MEVLPIHVLICRDCAKFYNTLKVKVAFLDDPSITQILELEKKSCEWNYCKHIQPETLAERIE